MRKLYISSIILIMFSCKKHSNENTSTINLKETRWNLHYKNSNIFSFYAVSELYFKADNSIKNFRNFDTISGNWNSSLNNVSITFMNGDNYTGTIITDDSISGTIKNGGNNGNWYAIRN